MRAAIGVLVTLAVALPACSTDDDVKTRTDAPDGGNTTTPDQDEIVGVYGSAWNEPDAEKRLTALEASLTTDVVYVDPTVDTTTRDALSDAIGEFITGFPGATIVQTSGLDLRNGELRFAWELQNGGTTAVRGLDYMEIGADGIISNIRGYWEPLPTAVPEGALGKYVTAWTATDDAERTQLLTESVTASARFTSSTASGEGPDDTASALPPASTVTFVGAQAYPKFARATFDVAKDGETVTVTDYVYLDTAGKITRIARFEGGFPAL